MIKIPTKKSFKKIQQMFRSSNTINYPDWATIRYSPLYGEIFKSFSMYDNEEIVGYAVVVMNYEKNNKTGQYIKFLGSFEVKYKHKGLGSKFINYLSNMGPIKLNAINASGPFYYIHGAHILSYDGPYEDCLMLFDNTDNTTEYTKDTYIRKFCKNCNMLHHKEYPEECLF